MKEKYGEHDEVVILFNLFITRFQSFLGKIKGSINCAISLFLYLNLLWIDNWALCFSFCKLVKFLTK